MAGVLHVERDGELARLTISNPAKYEEGGFHTGRAEELEDAKGVVHHPALEGVPLVAADVRSEGLGVKVIFHVHRDRVCDPVQDWDSSPVRSGEQEIAQGPSALALRKLLETGPLIPARTAARGGVKDGSSKG